MKLISERGVSIAQAARDILALAEARDPNGWLQMANCLPFADSLRNGDRVNGSPNRESASITLPDFERFAAVTVLNKVWAVARHG